MLITIIFFPVLRPLSVYGTKDSPGRIAIHFYQTFAFVAILNSFVFICCIWNIDHLHLSCPAECVLVRGKAEIEIFQAKTNTDIFWYNAA
jgi:hypothetical protein